MKKKRKIDFSLNHDDLLSQKKRDRPRKPRKDKSNLIHQEAKRGDEMEIIEFVVGHVTDIKHISAEECVCKEFIE